MAKEFEDHTIEDAEYDYKRDKASAGEAIAVAGAPIKVVDKKHRRKWFDNRCPKCSSRNITPVGKHARGKEEWCWYICEDCGDGVEFGPLKYAESY